MPPLVAPDPELLRLGAGQLYFDRWDADGNAQGFKHIGNLDSLEITLTPDVLIKRSTMVRSRPIYKKITRAIDTVVRAVGDEWSTDNLAMMFMGDVAYVTQSATPVTAQVVVADVPAATLGAALGGRFFFVGALNLTAVSMDVGASALDADDFEVANAGMGLIYIKPTSTTVTNGTDDLTVDYTAQAITGTGSPVVRGGSQAEVQGTLMFLEDNSAGENHIFRAWSASVTPDGAIGLISEEFGTFALNFTLQDDSIGAHGGSAADPLFHMQYVPAAA